MISIAKEMNLQIKKNEDRRAKLNNRFHNRCQYLSSIKNQPYNRWSHQMFVDPVSLYLYLTMDYWRRVEKRSIKTMNITLSGSIFIDRDSVLVDQMFEKVIKQFAKHQIKMTVKTREINGVVCDWFISLKTLELY